MYNVHTLETFGANSILSGDANRIWISWMFGCKPKKGIQFKIAVTAVQDINSLCITQSILL